MKEVLLVGNPNSGKTTLFNSLTRSNEHVGNWHGVTVDAKRKTFKFENEDFVLIDTPGIYSLVPLSFEEEVAVDTILSGYGKKIINLCDQNNLQRNLYLTLCLIEKGCDVVLAINEIDRKPIFKVDCEKLSSALGIDVVLVNAEKKVGLDRLKKCLFNQTNGIQLPYMKNTHNSNQDTEDVRVLSKKRYDFVDQVLKVCAVRTQEVYGKSKLDKFVLNRFLAFPIFMLVLAGVFWLTFFSLGAFLSDCLQDFFGLISAPVLTFVENVFANSWVYDLFSVAIFGGVATVLSFLPQVVLLFFFLSVLEDSGYMSRIAFVFEDIFGKIGLSGKSVYTLLMGFGCSTSAIMTSRNMDDKNAKIKTAILCPYMSCSAKIPIYTVVGGAFFGGNNLWCIIGLYVLGVVVAILISKILDVFVLKSQKQTFILEFPPYRRTSLKRVGKILWKNVKEFLIKVGSIMISMNIIIWLLSSFSIKFAYVPNDGGVSILESVGRILSPIFAPLGFDNWAIVASLLAGLVAKEVVVSSIAMFNGIDSSATRLIKESLLLETSVIFFASKASVLSFLVFCLLYTPCVASISMLLQEIGRKWTFVSIAIQLFTAYVVAFVVYNIAFAIEIFGWEKPLLILLTTMIVVGATVFVIRKTRKKQTCAYCDSCNKNCKNKKD